MKIFLLSTLLLGLLQVSMATTVNVGLLGFNSFGYSTQKKEEGSKGRASLKPGLSLGLIYPLISDHVLNPEIGHIFYFKEFDEYSKSTNYFLLDMGYKITSQSLLRYGFGYFLTSIKGDGGAVELNNGTSTSTFYRPGEQKNSHNLTLNLGVEFARDANLAFRFETYLFSAFSSTARKLSYTLNLIYFFNG